MTITDEEVQAIIDGTAWATVRSLLTELLALRHSSAEAYRRGVEDAAKVAEHMLAYADTTNNADKEIPAAIRALTPTGGGNG